MKSVILFTAPWCGSCPAAKSALAKAGIEHAIVDVDAMPTLGIEHRVLTLPTAIVTDNGKELVRYSGRIDPQKIKEALQ